MKLAAHRYGKSRVRVMKVLRDGDTHAIKELTTRVLLEGTFERSFTNAENALVVATDTVKNTINVLAHEHLGLENEPFARCVAEHFLGRYDQVSRVTVDLVERVWTRLPIVARADDRRSQDALGEPVPGRPASGDSGSGRHDTAWRAHPHSFSQSEVARPFTRLIAERPGSRHRSKDGSTHGSTHGSPHRSDADATSASRHESGIRDLVILKSTGSGFEDFHRDDLTTLPETRERILATALRATWRWTREPASYRACHRTIIDALLARFAERYSPSVQATVFEMATAALEACPEIDRLTLAMPNLHCLPIDLSPFGRTNRHELFVPTDEPHGVIEATVTR